MIKFLRSTFGTLHTTHLSYILRTFLTYYADVLTYYAPVLTYYAPVLTYYEDIFTYYAPRSF